MMEPQEIEDEEHEQVLERVAAVDVAKASGMVCTRVPHEGRPGKRRTRVWQVDATTDAILELADHLVAEGVEKVTLESTSDYWRIWFYLLEAAGLDVQLVRAAGREAGPGQAQDGQAGCGVAGQADRTGHAAALVSSRRRRSASCGTTPGCAPTWPASAPGTTPGWRNCWKTP